MNNPTGATIDQRINNGRVKGTNKDRDIAICKAVSLLLCNQDFKGHFWDACGLAAQKYELTQERVRQIVRENHNLLDHDLGWEKKLRVWRLQREINNKDKSDKDVADLLEQTRKELEGDKTKVEHHHIGEVILKISDETNIPLAQESGSDSNGQDTK